MTEPPAIFYLARHAPADWSADAVDPPLSAQGWAQARRMAARCAHLPISRVVTSPLRRARQTASLLAEAHHCPVQEEAHLQELGTSEFRPDFEQRVERWLQTCPPPPAGTLWVSHGGFLNVVLSTWRVRVPQPSVPRDRHGSLLAPGEVWALDAFGAGALAWRIIDVGEDR
ncbi:histidine phosphatase family protein [Corallococcus carmarthensis]|uniref:Histidine phosphatase family protein n=1 Tax=Corallococcus carmarthensis TaxID=2316728 RepID=A0A3A8JR51_9BACT|nr:hypothetical protein D7X32_32030 [Corallococcus carmarthensis]